MRLKPEPLQIAKFNWLKPAIPVVVLIMIAAVVYLGLDFTGRSSGCGNCHAMRAYVDGWRQGTHKKAECVDCHQGPGIMAALAQRADTLKHYTMDKRYIRRGRPTLAGTVSTAGCLDCHENIAGKTIMSSTGVRVSHKEIIEAGLGCGRCHAQTGHKSKAAKAARPVHDYCFACHRRMEKGARCDFCHTRDVAEKGPTQIEAYRRVDLDLNRCNGCHTTDSCAGCHPEGRRLQSFGQF